MFSVKFTVADVNVSLREDENYDVEITVNHDQKYAVAQTFAHANFYDAVNHSTLDSDREGFLTLAKAAAESVCREVPEGREHDLAVKEVLAEIYERKLVAMGFFRPRVTALVEVKAAPKLAEVA